MDLPAVKASISHDPACHCQGTDKGVLVIFEDSTVEISRRFCGRDEESVKTLTCPLPNLFLSFSVSSYIFR